MGVNGGVGAQPPNQQSAVLSNAMLHSNMNAQRWGWSALLSTLNHLLHLKDGSILMHIEKKKKGKIILCVLVLSTKYCRYWKNPCMCFTVTFPWCENKLASSFRLIDCHIPQLAEWWCGIHAHGSAFCYRHKEVLAWRHHTGSPQPSCP